MSAVLVPLVDGFEDIEAITAVDVLRRGGVRVVTAAVGTTTEVASAHGVVLRADALLSDVLDADYDAILLPGGPGTPALKDCEPLMQRLRRQHDEGRLLAAICAAPTVLVAAGVADESLHMTCYPSCMLELDRPYSNVPVVADGPLVTGQAPGSALLFSLIVLQTLEGESVARKVARGMVTDVLDPD